MTNMPSIPHKAVLLDRDDTIIEDKIYLNDPNQIHYLPGAFDQLKRLQDNGFKLVIVTNQSGVARGIVEPKNLEKIHEIINEDYKSKGIHIEGFFSAPYLTSSNHYYRKPEPGMLNEACYKFNLDPSRSWMIGDRMTDVEAGHRAGMKSVLLTDKEPPSEYDFQPPELVANNLKEMVDFVLSNDVN